MIGEEMKKSIFDRKNNENDRDRGTIGSHHDDPMSETTDAPRRTTGLPTNISKDFVEMLNDDASMKEASEKRKQRILSSHDNDPVAKTILEQEGRLKEKYAMGGARAKRILTTDILIDAPKDYFTKYYDFVAKAVSEAREAITARGFSDHLADALDNPADEKIQEETYRKIEGIISEKIENSPFTSTIDTLIIRTLAINDIMGFGIIDPLWRDKEVSEIIINGPYDVQIERHGKLSRVPGAQFIDTAHLYDLIEKIYRTTGKMPSATSPLVKGNLPDKSRVFAVDTSIAPAGPNLSIRKHPERYWTPEDMVKLGSASEELMTYIGNLIYKGASVLVVGGTHSGKALTLDTLINTPQGQISMNDIKEGDQVIDHNGIIGTVQAKYPQPARQVYAVVFSNKEVAFCDLEHNWYVYDTDGQSHVMTTEEIINSGISNGEGEYKFSIPSLSTPVEYESGMTPDEFAHHPYKIGISVGRKCALPDYLNDIDSPNNNKYRANLVQHGIIERTESIEKIKINADRYVGPHHIEDQYKFSSVESRRHLLAGLIDSIGYSGNSTGTWNLKVTSETLASDIQFIASSLGYIVEICTAKKESYVQEGTRVEDVELWEVKINSSETLGYSHIWETMIEEMDIEHQATNVNIVSIQPVEGRVEEMACITVDTPENTYTIGNGFTTTHNTTLLNAFTGFYKNTVRIVTIEDNIEMKPNPKKMLAQAMETKPASRSSSSTPVEMTDLVRASTQMRPDVIIVGEVTDQSALDLMEVMNTGHAGASTVHANTAGTSVNRMISLAKKSQLVDYQAALDMFAQAFDIIVVTQYSTVDHSRRIVNVSEVGHRPTIIDGIPTVETYPLWKFVSSGRDANGKIQGNWEKVGDISDRKKEDKNLNMEEDLTWEQLKEISSIPEEMQPKIEDD